MKPRNNNKEKEALRAELLAAAPECLFGIEKEIAFLIEEQRFEKGLGPKEYGLEWDKIEGRATKRLRKIIHDKRVRIGKEKFRQVAIQTLIQKQNLPSFKAFREQVRARLAGESDDQSGSQQRKPSSTDPIRLVVPSPTEDDIRSSPSRGRRRSSIVEDLRSELRELALLWYESERANSGKVDWPKLCDRASSTLQALLTEKRQSTHFEQCPLELLVPVKERRAFELLKSRLEQGMVSPRHVRYGGTDLPFLAPTSEQTASQRRHRSASGRLPSREPPAWRRLTIGSRVGIYWTDDKRYYKATVLDRYGGSSNMSVRYDDNVVEKLDMAKETIRVLEGREAEKDDPSDYQDVESDAGASEGAPEESSTSDKDENAENATEESPEPEEAIGGAAGERQKSRRAGVVAAAKAASVWKPQPQKGDGSKEGETKTELIPDSTQVADAARKSEFVQSSDIRIAVEKVGARESQMQKVTELAIESALKESAYDEAVVRPVSHRDDSKQRQGGIVGPAIDRNKTASVGQKTEAKFADDQRPLEIPITPPPSRIPQPITVRVDGTDKRVEGAAPGKTDVVEIVLDAERKGESAGQFKEADGESTMLVAEVLTAMGSLTKDDNEKQEGLPSADQDNPPDPVSTKDSEAAKVPDAVASKETPAPAKKRTRKRKNHEDQYLPPVLGELAALLARGTDENQRPDWKFIQRNASKSLRQYMNKKEGVSALVPNEVFDRFVHEVAEERNIWLIDELGRDPVTGEMLAPPPPPPPPPPPVPQPAPQFHLGFPLAAMYANARVALANGHVPIHPVAAVAPPVMQGEQFRKLSQIEDYDRNRKRRFGDFMNGARQHLIDYQKDENTLMESFFRGYR